MTYPRSSWEGHGAGKGCMGTAFWLSPLLLALDHAVPQKGPMCSLKCCLMLYWPRMAIQPVPKMLKLHFPSMSNSLVTNGSWAAFQPLLSQPYSYHRDRTVDQVSRDQGQGKAKKKPIFECHASVYNMQINFYFIQGSKWGLQLGCPVTLDLLKT